MEDTLGQEASTSKVPMIPRVCARAQLYPQVSRNGGELKDGDLPLQRSFSHIKQVWGLAV